MISVCFRFDDPSATSDHDLEKDIFAIFSSFGFSLTAAVIPYKKSKTGDITKISKENIAHLIEAEHLGIIDIAQHGHSHLRHGNGGDGRPCPPSEFSDVSMTEQKHLIKEGATLISSVFGHKIIGFVPPWNSYDQITANVLDELGFKYISAGWENFKSENLAILPRTCTMRNADKVIKEAVQFQELSPVIVVVFHPDEFEEFMSPPDPGEAPPFTNLSKLKEILNFINEHPNIELSTIKNITTAADQNRKLWTPHQLILPYRIKALVPPNMLFRSNRLKILLGMLKNALSKAFKL